MAEFNKKAQRLLNALGAKPALTVDGDAGAKTNVAMDLALAKHERPASPVTPAPLEPKPPVNGQGIREPKFVVVKGIRFDVNGKYQTKSGKFEGLTVHYAVCPQTDAAAKGVLNYLSDSGYGCMVMGPDGTIYIPEGFDIFTDWNDHSGKSKWKGRTSVSKYFAGMEICCWGKDSKVGPFRESKGEANIIPGKYQTFTKEQEAELINFILWARQKNPAFDLDNVVGHDELRAEYGLKGDKQDPGASLSMTMPEFSAKLKALV